MNYCLIIFIAVPLVCLLLVRVEYRRSERDQNKPEERSEENKNSIPKF